MTRVVLPKWATGLRDHQAPAIDKILHEFEQHDFVFLDAPTGSGKTLIAEVVRQRMQVDGTYTCATKLLQEQVERDFPWARRLVGKANYMSEKGLPVSLCDRTVEGDKWSCSLCTEQCPYHDVAKKQAAESPLAILNWSLYSTINKHPKSAFRDRGLTIIDEADGLEEWLMGEVTVTVNQSQARELGMKVPSANTSNVSKSEWMSEYNRRHKVMTKERSWDKEELVKRRSIEARLDAAIKTVKDDGWAQTKKQGVFELAPVFVQEQAPKRLWQYDEKFLLMSASFVSVDEMVDSLGIEGTVGVVSVESTFPAENRPMYWYPGEAFAAGADMTAKVNEVDLMAELVAEVIDRHPGENILVHTRSYDRSRNLYHRLQDRNVIFYDKPSDKPLVTKRMKEERGLVLLASSMERGVDFKGDSCTVQVIAKVPYPARPANISKRMQRDKRWYSVQTARNLLQSTGRGIRSKDDKCVTYILDADFARWYRRDGKELLPEWWKAPLEAVRKETEHDLKR